MKGAFQEGSLAARGLSWAGAYRGAGLGGVGGPGGLWLWDRLCWWGSTSLLSCLWFCCRTLVNAGGGCSLLQARLGLSGGEACCPLTCSRTSEPRPRVSRWIGTQPAQRRAGVRRSAFTRCFWCHADGFPAARSSAARTSVSWGGPELTPAARNGAAWAD